MSRTRTRTETLEDLLEQADALALTVRAARNAGGDRWHERIPAGAVETLVLAWQLGDRIERRARRATSPAEKRRWMRHHARLGEYGGEAVEALVGLVLGDATRSFTTAEREEWRDEAKLHLLVLLRDYLPKEGNNVEQYIATRARWIRNEIRRNLAETHEPKSWARTRAAALSVRDELTARNGRNPTTEELRDATEVRLREQIQQRNDSDRDLSDEQIHARLRRDGHLSALRELDVVLVSGLRAESLDEPVGEDGASLVDRLAAPGEDRHGDGLHQAVLRIALGDDADWAEDALLGRYGIDNGDAGGDADKRRSAKVPYAELAQRVGRHPEQVKAVTRRAVSRLTSPHAHFAHLVEHDIDVERPTLLGGYDR